MNTINPTSRVVSESNKNAVEESETTNILLAIVDGFMAVACVAFYAELQQKK